MLRIFKTHEVRNEVVLSGKLWKFQAFNATEKAIDVIVPSCWETYPGFESYRGIGCYTTSFNAKGNIRLLFKGVSHGAKIYVDNIFQGEFYNAYTPFSVNIKDLAEGNHELRVLVDNNLDEKYSLNIGNDYMNYGGINRAVAIQEISNIYIRNIFVEPIAVENGIWNAEVKVDVENLGFEKISNIDLCIQINNTQYNLNNLSIETGISTICNETIKLEDIIQWDIEKPQLYEVKCQLYHEGKLFDDLIDRVGFRTTCVKGNRVLINDKAVRIKGVNRHEDHPQYGSALPVEAMINDLHLIKDLGCNSIRTSHYPNDEIFLDLCDEMGILVWEESHARGLDETIMKRELFQEQSLNCIKEMVTSHYNHPSIYIWGILNECASDSEFARPLYKEQLDLIASLDKSRLKSFATCKFHRDICMDLPDVISWNIYPYWYEDRTATDLMDEVYNYSKKQFPSKEMPFLITEIGAGAIYGYRTPTKDKWSEEYQSYALDQQLNEVLGYDNCFGVYVWQFSDIRVSKEWFKVRPKSKNNKGIVDEYRRPKLSYEKVKSIFSMYSDYFEE